MARQNQSMLQRERKVRSQFHQLLDACLFALSFWFAYHLRASPELRDLFKLAAIEPFDAYAVLYIVLIPVAPLVLEWQGFYRRPIFASRRATAWMLFKACVTMSLGLVLALFLFHLLIARWVIVLFGCIAFVLIFVKEEVVRAWAQRRLGREGQRRRFVLAGTGGEMRQMEKELSAKLEEEVEIPAHIDLGKASVQDLVHLLHEHSVSSVVISARHAQFDQVEAAIRACEIEGVEAWLIADFFRTQVSRATFDDFHGWPVLVFRSTPESSWQSVLKKLLDFFGALVLLLMVAVPLTLIAVLIKLTSKGPVLFRQQRSGLNGRPFMIYKFRTMVTNAEQLKHELASMNEMTGPVFKVTNDPRITPLGKFLRKFSLDEFPQLLNVLRGEMSLVGPRPLPVDEVKRFNDLAHRRRLSVKPGLTCLWQISGRNNVKDFRDWVRLDLEYIDNWSFWLDVKILWLTIPTVLTGAGAK
jgi:exopolysaccharide biosynthesis polyprenyl glycosylphosphotransferase